MTRPTNLLKQIPAPWLKVGLALTILALTIGLYLPALNYGFINYDDKDYVTENPRVASGLSAANIQWAFTAYHASNWHPVTWMSHMMDVSLFGLNPRYHHLTSILLHGLNTILLLGLSHRLLGSVWQAIVIALLFALHPLRVESVVWISERKDVLSALFGLGTLWAYVAYAKARAMGQKATATYGLALGLFALGLLSKPMLVTWPALLILLDALILQRLFHPGPPQQAPLRAWLDKIPFAILSLASCLITLAAQRKGGAVATLEQLPFGERLGNAALSYWRYLGKTIWPTDLAVFYPHSAAGTGLAIGAGLALLSLTYWLWRLRQRFPFLILGWGWFVVTLLPVIGIIQVGSQSMADRYTYLPGIGLIWAIIPLICLFGGKLPFRTRHAITATILAVILGGLTRQQISYWQDSTTLFSRALMVGGSNATCHYYLGNALVESGKYSEGLEQLELAATLNPKLPSIYTSKAYALGLQRQFAESVKNYQNALELRPEFPEALNNLAWLLATCPEDAVRNPEVAISVAERAVQLSPQPQFLGTLAAAYAAAQRFPEAITTATRAQELALQMGLVDLAKLNGQLLELYRSGRAYRAQ